MRHRCEPYCARYLLRTLSTYEVSTALQLQVLTLQMLTSHDSFNSSARATRFSHAYSDLKVVILDKSKSAKERAHNVMQRENVKSRRACAIGRAKAELICDVPEG